MARHNRTRPHFDPDQEERATLLTAIAQMESRTELGAKLLLLRLQMLREGQALRSLDEINRELAREKDAELVCHLLPR